MTNREYIPLNSAQPPFFFGIDVGGTSIKFGLTDDNGQTLWWKRIPTEAEGGQDHIIRRLEKTVNEGVADVGLTLDDVAAIGLGTPGTMDIKTGVLLTPHNLPSWSNFPVRDQLSAACGRPVNFGNDATAAAYGEYWVGSGQEYDSLIFLTLGTGVGGGLIQGDHLPLGHHSHGAEYGHILIDPSDTAPVCTCGFRGHLEAYASATALAKNAREGLRSGAASSTSSRLEQGEQLTPLLLAEEAEKGDPFSLDLILEAARILGIGIVTLMHAIDPEAVIIGGAMTFGGHDTDVGKKFLQRIQQEIQDRAFPVLAAETVLDFASLGEDAGYLGAAGLARAASRAVKD